MAETLAMTKQYWFHLGKKSTSILVSPKYVKRLGWSKMRATLYYNVLVSKFHQSSDIIYKIALFIQQL